MGYSYSTKAGLVQDAIMVQLKAASNREIDQSNAWENKGSDHFFENGREQHDGAITGTVWRINKSVACDKQTCHKVGSAKIDRLGKVVRWPTSTKAMRESAETCGLIEFTRIYQRTA